MDKMRSEDVQFVDLRFTDPRGKWQHTAQAVHTIDEDTFEDGIMFDGSSIAGWKVINESDMVLMPDPATAVMDPFTAQSTMILFCAVLEPSSCPPYRRDPRYPPDIIESPAQASDWRLSDKASSGLLGFVHLGAGRFATLAVDDFGVLAAAASRIVFTFQTLAELGDAAAHVAHQRRNLPTAE